MAQLEHNLQVACVTWFRLRYSPYKRLLFAIPNGGLRNLRVAQKLKSEGVLAGVSDIFLMKPNKHFSGLWIEMKVKPNKLTESQIEFGVDAINRGFSFKVCYSIDEFMEIINEYMK